MKDIREYEKGKIDILEMQKYLGIREYVEFVGMVKELELSGIISPIKSSRANGKRPPLYNRYNIIKEKFYSAECEEELRYRINPALNTDYYIKNMDKYREDKKFVLQLSGFLNSKKELLEEQISLNERSFQIWSREKYLSKEGGKRLLKNLNFPLEKLNTYSTTEPLAYYSKHREHPQKLLIVENKDTFYTIRRHLMAPESRLMGVDIATVIYGSGKTVFGAIKDFDLCMEPYLLDGENEFLYLGDIDYEGIGIYEQLCEVFKSNFDIKLFVPGYVKMVDKALDLELPDTKDGQNKNIKDIFFNQFDAEYQRIIKELLTEKKYIPQEILTCRDFNL